MRAIITAALAIALAACGGAQQQLAGKPAEKRVHAVATLATSSCEVATAADYTATETAVQKATLLVRAGTMSPADAQRVADDARVVRTELAATCANRRATPDAAAHARARAAMAKVLKGVQ